MAIDPNAVSISVNDLDAVLANAITPSTFLIAVYNPTLITARKTQKVTVQNLLSLAVIPISQVTGLQTTLDSKLNTSDFTELFQDNLGSLVLDNGSLDVTYNDPANTFAISLVNDNGNPGNLKYYGTNGSGVKGWFDLPSGGSGSSTWGSITGTLSSQTDLQTALDGKQPVNVNLTTIAGLTPSTGQFLRFGTLAWESQVLTAGDIPNLSAAKITSGTLADSVIPASIARDSEVTAAITAHEGTRNHPTATTSLDGLLSAADKTKLDGVATGATANSPDATLLNRANHTGTQATSTVTGLDASLASKATPSDITSAITTHEASRNHPNATTSLAGFLSSTDKTKLDGIASGATANSTDATLLNRANHTGTQLSSTISDFTEATQDVIGALILDSGSLDATYNDPGNAFTINLVNDNATPGNSKYYGTDSGGIKGFFNLPTGGSINTLTFSNADRTILSSECTGTNLILRQTGTLSALRSVTLPAANSVNAGYVITIMDESGSTSWAFPISILAAGTNTIIGYTNSNPYRLELPYQSVRLLSDGTSKWTVLGDTTLQLPNSIYILDEVFNPIQVPAHLNTYNQYLGVFIQGTASIASDFFAIDSGNIGHCRGVSGTSSGSSAALISSLEQVVFGIGSIRYLARISVGNLATVAQDFITVTGIGNTMTDEPTSGVYFMYNRSISSNWLACTANGGTRTRIDTGIPVTTSWFKLSYEINAAGTSVTFYVGNTSVATITTNIPTSHLGFIPVLGRKTNGTTNIFLWRIDYWQFLFTPTNLRA